MISHPMRKENGLNAKVFNIASRLLTKRGFINTIVVADYNSDGYNAYTITDSGEAWILSNLDKLDINLTSNN